MDNKDFMSKPRPQLGNIFKVGLILQPLLKGLFIGGNTLVLVSQNHKWVQNIEENHVIVLNGHTRPADYVGTASPVRSRASTIMTTYY